MLWKISLFSSVFPGRTAVPDTDRKTASSQPGLQQKGQGEAAYLFEGD